MLNLYFAANNACNLRCKYCYLPEHRKNGDKATDDRAIMAAAALVEKCQSESIQIGTVTLHGAESGLLSPEAAATIANTFAEYGEYRYPVAIQSNGTLFSPEYFDRFEQVANDRLKFAVGISLDGPAEITDKIRGKGVYKRALAGLQAASTRGYKTQILCVVSSVTVSNLKPFGDWMKSLAEADQAIRFKPAHGVYHMNADEQTRFAEWLNDTGYARYYQEIDQNICCSKGNHCFWLQVDVDGNCYSCNKSYGNQRPFANWRNEPMQAVLDKRRSLFHSAATHPACEKCEIHSACNSGCPVERDESGLAVDCVLKRALLARASSQSGLPWQEIVGAASRFQLAGRYSGIVTISDLRITAEASKCC